MVHEREFEGTKYRIKKSIEVQLKCIFKNWEKNMLARSHTRPGIGVERCPTSMFKVTLVYQQT